MHQEVDGRFSPDGRWVTYTSQEAGRPHVYVNSFPDPGRKLRISVDPGGTSHWSVHGEIFYRGPEQMVMRAVVSTEPDLRVGSAEARFPWSGNGTLALAADGSRFLGLRLVDSGTPNRVVVRMNWLSAYPELVE